MAVLDIPGDAARAVATVRAGGVVIMPMDVGYAAIADVYFTLWEKALQNPNGTAESAKFKSLAEKAIKLLRAFKNVFPIGQPSLLYYQGWYEWLNGKRSQAVRTWNLGLEAAQKFRMRYEEGLIHMKLGGALAENAVLRREHYDRAVRIFGEMDAIPMLRRTRELENLK